MCFRWRRRVGLGRPDPSIAGAVLALVVGSTRISFGQAVVPHPAATLGTAHSVHVGQQGTWSGTRVSVASVCCRTRSRTRLAVAPNVRELRVFQRLGVLAIAVHLDPVLLVRV